MTTAVEVQDVSKRFRLYQEKYTSLKERVLHAGRNPHRDLWALSDVNLEIAQGETLGIVGRNGCGKSTLLKCIAGILKPTTGEIRIRGHLAAMLELGAGFQPELTGRDNIFLNASLLGMSRRDVEKNFDEIVAFAELEESIDNQVRFYSSGMYVRLGFAVAVNVDPDVLLVDEVLAVGDERFQQKCMQRIHDFQEEGRTIVVVSHAVDVMRQLCTRVAVIESGHLLTIAPPGEAIRVFRDVLDGEAPPAADTPVSNGAAPTTTALSSDTAGGAPTPGNPPTGEFHALRIVGSRLEAGDRPHLYPGEPASVVVELEAIRPFPAVVFGCSVFSGSGALIFDYDSGTPTALPVGRTSVRFRIDSVPLLDGAYTVNVRVQEPRGGAIHARRESAATIVVENPGTSTGIVALPVSVEVSRPGVPGDAVPDQLVP